MALRNQDNPVHHSMEVVLPGVHARLGAITSEINRTRETLMQAVLNNQAFMEENRRRMMAAFGNLSVAFAACGENVDAVMQDVGVDSPGGSASGGGVLVVDELQLCCGHRMSPTMASIGAGYCEYNGLEAWEGKPIAGGLAACEFKFKAKWRKDYSGAEARYLSRVKQIMRAVDNLVAGGGGQLAAVVNELDVIYGSEEVKRSPSKMIAVLKAKFGSGIFKVVVVQGAS